MDIAKPVGGFNIVEPATVKTLIASHAKQRPRITAQWADVKARLKQTGHRDGEPVHGRRSNRLFIAEGDPASGLPTIKVAYSVLGDTLHIRMVMVVVS